MFSILFYSSGSKDYLSLYYTRMCFIYVPKSMFWVGKGKRRRERKGKGKEGEGREGHEDRDSKRGNNTNERGRSGINQLKGV